MTRVLLSNRSILSISGEEAKQWLNSLITCDIETLQDNSCAYGALLMPQGKIISDFFIFRQHEELFYLDCPQNCAMDLLKKFKLYKLRAKVTIEDLTSEYKTIVGWNEDYIMNDSDSIVADDPRLLPLGWRALIKASNSLADVKDDLSYYMLRHSLGVPEGGEDYQTLETFPHEAFMEKLHGVSFSKGCYIGQEVVSRMQHKAVLKTRIMPFEYAAGKGVETGDEIYAGKKVIGRVGSFESGKGFAVLRLDQMDNAKKQNIPLTINNTEISIATMPWMEL